MVFALTVFTLNCIWKKNIFKREKKNLQRKCLHKRKREYLIYPKFSQCKTTNDVFYEKQGVFRIGHIRAQR